MTRFADLPLFASDKELADALLGKNCVQAFGALVKRMEPEGFPQIDPDMGGRYTPAVKAFFDHRYRLLAMPPAAPPGIEGDIQWNRQRGRRHLG